MLTKYIFSVIMEVSCRMTNIKFQYFRIFKENNKDELMTYSLINLIHSIYDQDICYRNIKINGYDVRIELIERFNDGYCHLEFMKLTDPIMINKSTIDKQSEPLCLQENEYLGKELHIFYDEKNHFLMVQKNRNVLTPNGIAQYFNGMLKNMVDDSEEYMDFFNEKSSLSLKPFFDSKQPNFDRVTSLELEYANAKGDIMKDCNSINELAEKFNVFEPEKVLFKMSVPKNKGKFLKLIDEIFNKFDSKKDDSISKVLINYEGDDGEIYLYDLINNLLEDSIEFDGAFDSQFCVRAVEKFEKRIPYLKNLSTY